MNSLLLSRLDKIERELKTVKNLLKKRSQKSLNAPKNTAGELSFKDMIKKLKTVGKEITPREIEEEIRAYRAGQ